jgi:hypothetical protein
MKLDYKNIIENNLSIKKPVHRLLAYNNLLRAYLPSESTRLSPPSESTRLSPHTREEKHMILNFIANNTKNTWEQKYKTENYYTRMHGDKNDWLSMRRLLVIRQLIGEARSRIEYNYVNYAPEGARVQIAQVNYLYALSFVRTFVLNKEYQSVEPKFFEINNLAREQDWESVDLESLYTGKPPSHSTAPWTTSKIINEIQVQANEGNSIVSKKHLHHVRGRATLYSLAVCDFNIHEGSFSGGIMPELDKDYTNVDSDGNLIQSHLARINLLHNLHYSIKSPHLVAYYPTLKHLRQSREVVSTLGKYLARFSGLFNIPESAIKQMVDEHKSREAGKEGWAVSIIGGKQKDKQAWVDAYNTKNSLVHSCMANKKCVHVYAHRLSELKLVVLKNKDGKIIARCIVREVSKKHHESYGKYTGHMRVYPPESNESAGKFLSSWLKDSIYKTPTNFNYTLLDCENADDVYEYVAPYLDQIREVGGQQAYLCGDKVFKSFRGQEHEYLIVDNTNSDIRFDTTNGTTYSDNSDNDDNDNDEDRPEFHCDCCEDYFYEEDNDQYDVTFNGSHGDSHMTYCYECYESETYSLQDFDKDGDLFESKIVDREYEVDGKTLVPIAKDEDSYHTYRRLPVPNDFDEHFIQQLEDSGLRFFIQLSAIDKHSKPDFFNNQSAEYKAITNYKPSDLYIAPIDSMVKVMHNGMTIETSTNRVNVITDFYPPFIRTLSNWTRLPDNRVYETTNPDFLHIS